ncbi:MAG: RAMP superfamily CRISPR-associated protein [Armatimonadetes bacterium]|nr:RAMP superfamily CRISPR-associated protein [Armatimonadota bacterium]MDW8028168.1 RAMP superfamily CRISPR-associated protein [Armatimonadota bacterium]
MAVRLNFEIRFRFRSGFHTTGDRVELWTDKAVALDWREGENPIIPATSIKGWLRENAERVLRSFGQKVCDGSQPATICGKCLVCELFGHPRKKSPIRFEDAILENSLSDARTNVSLSRYRKTAYEERLFTTEVAWANGFVFKGEGFFSTSQEAEKAATLLWLAARLGFAIGASRSRGLGWLEFEDFCAQCDGASIDVASLSKIASSWRGEEGA